MNVIKLQQQLMNMTSMKEVVSFFEIDCESRFIDEYGEALLKRFSGNILLKKT